MIRDALANLAVRETARLTMGDHVGLCAEMVAAKFSRNAPLLYQLRQYRTVRDIG